MRSDKVFLYSSVREFRAKEGTQPICRERERKEDAVRGEYKRHCTTWRASGKRALIGESRGGGRKRERKRAARYSLVNDSIHTHTHTRIETMDFEATTVVVVVVVATSLRRHTTVDRYRTPRAHRRRRRWRPCSLGESKRENIHEGVVGGGGGARKGGRRLRGCCHGYHGELPRIYTCLSMCVGVCAAVLSLSLSLLSLCPFSLALALLSSRERERERSRGREPRARYEIGVARASERESLRKS